MKNKNKIVIFDFGGVILSVNHDKDYTYRKMWNDSLSEFTGVTKDYTDVWYNQLCEDCRCDIDMLNEYEYNLRLGGIITKVGKENTPTNVAILKHIIYKNTFKVDYYKDVLNLLYETNERCLTGILSNTPINDCCLQDILISDELIPYKWRSSEIGIGKPSKVIYEIVQDELELLAQSVKVKKIDVLYIDDYETNLVVPRELGWSTYKAHGKKSDYDNIKKAIDDFLCK